MDKLERRVQEALGLMEYWDVYAMFTGDDFFTIYRFKAPSKEDALREALEKIRASGCKIKQATKNCDTFFAVGPDPIGPIVAPGQRKYAK